MIIATIGSAIRAEGLIARMLLRGGNNLSLPRPPASRRSRRLYPRPESPSRHPRRACRARRAAAGSDRASGPRASRRVPAPHNPRPSRIVSVNYTLAHPQLETLGPIERARTALAPCVCMQVVDDVAAADDEHALVAQGRKPLAQLIMESGRLGLVDAELHDRDVRLGEYVSQHRPCPVVEPPSRR